MNHINYCILFIIVWSIGTLIMTFVFKVANEGQSDQILTKNRQYLFVGSLFGLILAITIVTIIMEIITFLN